MARKKTSKELQLLKTEAEKLNKTADFLKRKASRMFEEIRRIAQT